VRGGGVALACVATLGGLALGVQALGRPEPAPPAVPTPGPAPTPTPTPTPTTTAPSATVLPTADPSLPFGACGSTAEADPVLPRTDVATLTTRVETPSIAAGERLPVSVDVRPADWDRAIAVPPDGPRYLVVRDGVVVGTAAQHAAGAGVWVVSDSLNGSVTYSDRIELTVCAAEGQPDVTTGRPLPAGTYDVRPWAEIADLTSVDDGRLGYDPDRVRDLAALPGVRVTAVGPATTVTITGAADVAQGHPGEARVLAPAAPVSRPGCGDPAPALSPEGDLTVAVVDPAVPVVDLRYSGPGRVLGSAFYAVSTWVVQDGVVVGGTWYETDGGGRFDLADGPGMRFTEGAPPTRCPDDGAGPLPPGDYQAYAGISVWGLSRILPDGTVVRAPPRPRSSASRSR
jgi:hypothetical protein